MGQTDVVIVDDDEIFLDVVKQILAPVTSLVTTFNRGKPALAKLKELQPKVLVLDLNLPDIRGDQFLVKFSELCGWGDMMVLVVTGEQLSQEQNDLLRSIGTYRIIRKPIETESFLTTISCLLCEP